MGLNPVIKFNHQQVMGRNWRLLEDIRKNFNNRMNEILDQDSMSEYRENIEAILLEFYERYENGRELFPRARSDAEKEFAEGELTWIYNFLGAESSDFSNVN